LFVRWTKIKHSLRAKIVKEAIWRIIVADANYFKDLVRNAEEEDALVVLHLQVAAVLKDRQVFLAVRDAAVADSFRGPVRNVGEEEALVVLHLQVVLVTLQFQVSKLIYHGMT
jgi:hypothetical protein